MKSPSDTLRSTIRLDQPMKSPRDTLTQVPSGSTNLWNHQGIHLHKYHEARPTYEITKWYTYTSTMRLHQPMKSSSDTLRSTIRLHQPMKSPSDTLRSTIRLHQPLRSGLTQSGQYTKYYKVNFWWWGWGMIDGDFFFILGALQLIISCHKFGSHIKDM